MSHSQIATNDDLYCKDAVERIILDFSEPGKRSYGSQNPWSTIAEKEEGSERPDIGIHRKKAFNYYYHEQFMRSSPQQVAQSGMMTMFGLLKSGKLTLRCTSDRGDPM